MHPCTHMYTRAHTWNHTARAREASCPDPAISIRTPTLQAGPGEGLGRPGRRLGRPLRDRRISNAHVALVAQRFQQGLRGGSTHRDGQAPREHARMVSERQTLRPSTMEIAPAINFWNIEPPTPSNQLETTSSSSVAAGARRRIEGTGEARSRRQGHQNMTALHRWPSVAQST